MHFSSELYKLCYHKMMSYKLHIIYLFILKKYVVKYTTHESCQRKLQEYNNTLHYFTKI